MRFVLPLPNPALLAIVLGSLLPACALLCAQVPPPPPPPAPTCDGCGAQSNGGFISHGRGCPYGGAEDSDWQAPHPGPPSWTPTPPPESKFDRDKRELLKRLVESTPASRSFEDVRRDLLGQMQTGNATAFLSVRAGLEGRLAQGAFHDDPEVAAAAGELALKTPGTVAGLEKVIERRRSAPNADAGAVIRSLKVKAPPPLSSRFDNLCVGDVLLVRQPDDMLSVDFYTSGWIIIVDKLMTASLRPRASHTFMFVKEVNGVKLFLDNMPGQGTRVKSEAQILAEYSTRDFDVAQPLGKLDADALWKAARDAGLRSLDAFAKRSQNLIDTTDYGVWGDEDIVCSETSRWALMKAGLVIPETRSPPKEWLGVVFGPADFYLETDHFLVTPLSALTPRRDKATH